MALNNTIQDLNTSRNKILIQHVPSIIEHDDDTSVTISKVDSSEFDEVQDIRDHSKKDNLNVNISRATLVLMLLLVGIAVTWTTYIFLKKNEEHSFETAFEQFSKTVSDSAERHQQNIRDAYRSMANMVTAHTQTVNATWPFVTIPFFEAYAQHFLIQSGLEIHGFFPLVKNEKRQEWEQYATDGYEDWFIQAHTLHSGGLDRLNPVGYHPFITAPDPETGGFQPDQERDFYFPMWHFSPPPFAYGITNWNIGSVPDYESALDALLVLKNETIVTKVRKYVTAGVALSKEEHEAMHSKLPPGSSTEHPHSLIYHPIHEKVLDYNSPIVGVLGGGMAWDASLLNLLPEGVDGLYAVIENDCDQQYTYEINGPEAIFLGDGDLHHTKYEKYKKTVNLALHTHPDFASTPGHCQFSMHIYPTKAFESAYYSSVPIMYAIVVASTFVLVAIFFFVYNSFVNHRNEKLVHNAAKSNAVIHALFPKNIRDRIMEDEQKQSLEANKKKKNPWAFKSALIVKPNTKLSSSSHAVILPSSDRNRPPLADYFPETTILFADISGFTAWSSVREPSQVFTLLETLYGAFDKIAKQTRVFKVETVGDCYVAATGIPDFHPEHAVHMVQFARKILTEMEIMTKKLEITLGPDTGDLSLRIGIHSGPVTGGVLRGERARFQLFGDTMNTASRMENSSKEGRIQLSAETAELLTTFGKQHWLVKRKEPVKVKGKGDIQTYWVGAKYDHSTVKTTSQSTPVTQDDNSSSNEGNDILIQKPRIKNEDDMVEREARLVDWNVHMLIGFLKEIVARRIAAKGLDATTKKSNREHQHDSHEIMSGHIAPKMDEGFYPLNEVREVIRLPEFDSKVAKLQKNHHLIDIPLEVEQQLHLYVTCIAHMYRENHFHNFEHASHVTMSVIKLLSRIVAPTDIDDDLDGKPEASLRAQLHDHTYGITSDPLTQFACAFAALIHDVDHQGVPNAQLIKEQSDIAARFKDRSVAEQNSMVIGWNLLMEDQFEALRLCLCETPKELRRFRNLVINALMATDIADKDLKNLRNARWEKAFKEFSVNGGDNQQLEEDVRDGIHRKATIVIEHLLQASDVAHTMQHWHVYRKWNENFFRECYAAYKAGRAETDPSEGWYKGEIGFFDFYIIPLAKKLDTCGVFGKSSDEYLNYALQNREEWKTRGEQVVAEMVAAVEREYFESDI